MRPSSTLPQIILVALFAHLALAGARVATSLLALSLQATAFTVGTLIAVFALLPMLLALRTGRLVDRVGPHIPMAAGGAMLLTGCGVAAWAAAASSIAWLYPSAAMIGSGFMAVQIGTQHCVGALDAGEQRAANFSRLSLGFSVSGFTGPVLAGLLIDHLHYGAAYLAFCAFALTASLLVVRRHRATIAASELGKSAAQNVPTASAAGPSGRAPDSAFTLLRTPPLRHIYAVGILLAAAWDLFVFMLPLQGAHIGYSASTIGVVLGSFSAATFAVRVIMPWLMRRLSEWQLLFGALIQASLCYALFPFLQTPASFMAAAAALGLAVGASQPNMLALLHREAPTGRTGEALGLRITMGNACQVALPLAFGAAGAALGLGLLFGIMAVLIASGVPLAWRYIGRV